MYEQTPCNFCNLNDCEILAPDGLSQIVRCRNCRLVYRSPRKSKGDYLQVYYDNYYTPANRDWWYNRKIGFFKQATKKIGQLQKGKGRLLDLGCGFGFFLDLARQDDWDVYGIELSNYARAYAREQLKLNVFQGELKQAHFADNYFDVVTMWNFLDHLFDPLNLLKEVTRILKKSGLVAMRMPNMRFQLPGFCFLKRLENIIPMPDEKNPFVIHNYSFSQATLSAMLKKAGFSNIQVLNSRLSRRDPLTFINHCVFNLTQAIFYLSGAKALTAPSLEAYARR